MSQTLSSLRWIFAVLTILTAVNCTSATKVQPKFATLEITGKRPSLPPPPEPETPPPPPPSDRDGDGIIDDEDACPDTPGVRTEDPKTNGCPEAPKRVELTDTGIVIREKVQFKVNSPKIDKVSFDLLREVSEIIKTHEEIGVIRVEGHTDTSGNIKKNRKLSQQRADSVKKHLITKNKIDKKRLISKGFGPDQPIQPNDTPEGREANRRVEFKIDNPKPPAPAGGEQK